MYSGTTFRNKSGHIVGVHQRIDRLAKRNIRRSYGNSAPFPLIKDILHFEGNNGPDGVKRKSPSVDEPWHYIDPANPNDRNLVRLITDHQANLTQALKDDNYQRAAFEAAWLAHAIVDGLTPAHHYPLSDTIEKLWGKPKEERLTVLQKNLIYGGGKRDSIKKNWQYWGAKGIFITHVMFELGVASVMTTHRFRAAVPSQAQLDDVCQRGIAAVFLDAVDDIYELDMYHEFWINGQTAKLARQTRQALLPKIIITVTLAWHAAIQEAAK